MASCMLRGRGIVAIEQKGGGKNLAETRLYVYPDVDAEILYLFTIGDKKSQKTDVKTCQGYVEQLNKLKKEDDKTNDQGAAAQ